MQTHPKKKNYKFIMHYKDLLILQLNFDYIKLRQMRQTLVI